MSNTHELWSSNKLSAHCPVVGDVGIQLHDLHIMKAMITREAWKMLPAAVHFGNKWLENQKLMHQSTMNAYCISQLPAVSDCGYEETRYSIPPFLNPKPTSRFACSGHIWVELKACKKRCCGHVHTVYKASNDFHIWNKLSYLKLLYGTCFTDCRRLIV